MEEKDEGDTFVWNDQKGMLWNKIIMTVVSILTIIAGEWLKSDMDDRKHW